MIDLTVYPKFKSDPRLMKRISFLEVEWRRAYPDVCLEKQIGWASAWLVSSGKRYQDMARFLNNWFKRCQQDIEMTKKMKGPIRMPAKPYQEPKPEGEIMDGADFTRMKEAIQCKPTSI